ncbi:MAG: PilZ domain-containing protein [Candidatus Omnitrophica bacterium]|nr:PilZ domain-containing protein [Candidatus Omnitrophota bacterium]
MPQNRTQNKVKDSRRYIRVEGVLPVEFYVLNSQGKKVTPWLQGFTRDIGKGGICLTVNDLWWGFWDRFNFPGACLFVSIDLPFSGKKIASEASVAWVKPIENIAFNRYFVGLEFKNSKDRQVNSLFRYAYLKKVIPVTLSAVFGLLIIFSLFSFYRINNLIKERRQMVKDYVGVLERISIVDDQLKRENGTEDFIEKRKEELDIQIKELEADLHREDKNYQELRKTMKQEDAVLGKAEALNERIIQQNLILAQLKRENEFIREQAKKQKLSVQEIESEFQRLFDQKNVFSGKIVLGLIDWIKNRQDLIQGLVLSYEGDKDLDKVCFTYDQSLAAIVFILSADLPRAEKILDFYNNKVISGKEIFNAYYTNGYPFEMINHCGPIAWIGLSALTYMKETNSRSYLPLTHYVADFLLEMMDSEGGIKGGPTVSWYSTEHHLDAFAFFDLLYKLDPKPEFKAARDKVKNWIIKYAYSSYGTPVKRGKGDSTIATDTYSWSVTALGPQLLKQLKMSPDAILDFAIEHCAVKTKFKYRQRDIVVEGFDFAKARNVSRGGVVSCEWTAQMVLAFEIMADFYKDRDQDKSQSYFKQAEFYFDELQKMLITSLSRVGREDPCLPYASAASADTGHGWRTPQGTRTGSLAATAYFLIAYYGYNPLTAEELTLSLKNIYENRDSQITSKTY